MSVINRKIRSSIVSVLTVLMLLPNVSVKATVIEESKIKDTIIEDVVYDDKSSDDNLQAEDEEVIEEEIKEDSQQVVYEKNKDVIEEAEIITEDNKQDKVEENQSIYLGEKYDVEVITINTTLKNIEYEKEDFELKAPTLNQIKRLKTKTQANYEIALAYSDGNYTYLENAETYEEAKEKVDNVALTKKDDVIIPVIISKSGQVVYATRSMGKVIKYINGKPDATFGNNSNIYTDSALSNAYTYINHGHVDDVPVISDSGKSAKIQVSGNIGWINKDTSSKEYDLAIYPTNQVTNPSYYISEAGILYHFISRDLTSSSEIGSKIMVGPAPNYLKPGVKYLSYDGNYFYNGSKINEGLDALIVDLQNGTKTNAINKNEPYYNYYNYLPHRSSTNYSADDLNKYINENTESTSKLRGTGQNFIDAQNKYGVNALLALSTGIHESGWGMSDIAQQKNNLFGMNAIDSTPNQSANYYKNVADCIREFTDFYISRGYADPADWRYYGGFVGNKRMGANVKYASDPFWGEKIAAHYFRADYSLSGKNISNLKDFNEFCLVMFTSESPVKLKSNGTLLYNAKPGTVAVVSNDKIQSINGVSCYEINPERDTPINSGGPANEYHGSYNWSSKAYIPEKNIKLINKSGYYDWANHWARNEIKYAMDNGWVDLNNLFRPDDSITRAEFIKVVNRRFNFTAKATSESYTDVTSSDWWYEEVLIAIKNGYITTNNKEFRPEDPITREEVAVILTNIRKNKDSKIDKLNNYIDKNDVSNWALTSVEGAIEAEYMGVGTNKFRPKDNITRAEAVVTLYRN